MTKNTLGDLNNHLFEQMERLNDDDLTEEELDKEIKRADAMSDIASQVIGNASLILKAKNMYGDVNSSDPKDRPQLLEG